MGVSTDHDEDVFQEQLHLQKVISAFYNYRDHARKMHSRRRRDFDALPERHKKLIPHVSEKIDRIYDAIDRNDCMLKAMLEKIDDSGFFQLPSQGKGHLPSPMDMDKVRSTLKQFVRDWAVEGKAERDATYNPIINELNAIYEHVKTEDRGAIRVLVPGAGLGRLAYDIAKQGFSCQGNEFSFHMLLASYFILNNMERTNQFEIYPFIHTFSNIRSAEHQIEPVMIPDVVPENLPPNVDFSMVAGDFLEVYSDQEGAWDVVVTCFFIDTAKNILEYIEKIHFILEDGGTWINIGPLLYHFEDTPGESSIELSLEEVKQVTRDLGFAFKKESMISTTYTSNPSGMLKYVYECAYWCAVKETSPQQDTADASQDGLSTCSTLWD